MESTVIRNFQRPEKIGFLQDVIVIEMTIAKSQSLSEITNSLNALEAVKPICERVVYSVIPRSECREQLKVITHFIKELNWNNFELNGWM